MLQVLHNPRYAGAFVHGRTRWCRSRNGGKTCRRLPLEEWYALLPETHAGYITWEQYQRNQQGLRENARGGVPTDARARREKARHCCKEWCSVGSAGSG